MKEIKKSSNKNLTIIFIGVVIGVIIMFTSIIYEETEVTQVTCKDSQGNSIVDSVCERESIPEYFMLGAVILFTSLTIGMVKMFFTKGENGEYY